MARGGGFSNIFSQYACGVQVYLFLLTVLCLLLQGISSALLPSVFWDPFNPLFNCSSSKLGHPVINVNPYDRLSIICPHQALNNRLLPKAANGDNLFENAYILNPTQKDDFLACNSENGRLLLECSEPYQLKYYNFAFKQHAGSVNQITFEPGQDYYIIGTGKRKISNIKNRIGGSCKGGPPEEGFPLKLQIHVCSKIETEVYKNCSVCTNSACYSKGCSVYDNWTFFGTYRKLMMKPRSGALVINRESSEVIKGTKNCMEVVQRQSHNHPLDVTFSEVRFNNVSCPATDIDCTNWNPTDDTVYMAAHGSCFRLVTRRCSVPSFLQFSFQQTEKKTVPCVSSSSQPDRWKTGGGNNTVSARGDDSSRLVQLIVIPLTTLLLGIVIGYGIAVFDRRRPIHVVQKVEHWYRRRGKRKCNTTVNGAGTGPDIDVPCQSDELLPPLDLHLPCAECGDLEAIPCTVEEVLCEGELHTVTEKDATTEGDDIV